MEVIQKYNYMVCVECMTFNQARFIEDSMNGFCMQQTNFPFVCVVVDDGSTDGEQKIINTYIQNHFDMDDRASFRNEETDDYILTFARHKTNKNCFFLVLYLKYNHYNIKKDKRPYYSELLNNAKYWAICEGDDYWIHSQKLQIQVDFLEGNKSYTMVCNSTEYYSVKRNMIVGQKQCYEQSQEVDRNDVILRGGDFISTCSILYRPFILNEYPDYCKHCHVGDYPLQIMAAMKGNIYYFDDVFTVYRTDNPSSWCGRQVENLLSEKRLNGILSEIRMLQGFQRDYPNFASSFTNRINDVFIQNMPIWSEDPQGYYKFTRTFQKEIYGLGFKRRFKLIWMKSRFSKTYILYIYIKKVFKSPRCFHINSGK